LTEQYLDYLFNNSVFVSEEKYKQAVAEGRDLRGDPARLLYAAIRDVALQKMEIMEADDEKLAEATKAYTAGQMEWTKGQPLYPDANSTCRLSYGTVKSYSPKDGVLYKHYTTLKGVMEKEDPDNYEFRVPAKLKEIYQNKDYGQYANEDGELVTCFLTNNDITGGNSGSPVLNANGELIGLAFDGNWEAMSGDVIFEPNLQRCINVDIRYVLLMLDKFGGAGYLLDEMKLVK
ncbi:MAG: S46 family peptidase, partial [Bacteroidales bacterium]|nr:S46 family peptidase [Bacteroidales bacterium]